MKTNFFLVWMAVMTWSGCDKPKAPPPAPAAAPAAPEVWQARYDQLKAAVKIGMTEAEVIKAAGEPKTSYSYSGTSKTPAVTWEYEMPGSNRFAVRFGKDGKVVYADFDSATKVY
jgi:hypothetical protein